ncbi:MAG: Ig-like domain-containing protein, partial [Ignavibacteria bacterium]|nr:Ig-like domain-containing protein [Ignavibacteria bacterium]NNL21994.1 hypothetical protein [Ignavibacteriaceae bacterium]
MRIYFIALAVILLNLSIVAQGEFSVNDILPATQSMSSLPETEIAINFNSSFDINSINDTTFQVWGRWSGVHKGTISISNDSTTLHFDPDKNFFYGEWITVSLSKGIKDKEGNFLPSGFAWNFWIRTLPGTMNLTRTQTINVRQLSEGWIQTYGTYAGDLDGDGWSDFIVPNEIPADIRVFMNDQQGGYDDFTIFTINSGS